MNLKTGLAEFRRQTSLARLPCEFIIYKCIVSKLLKVFLLCLAENIKYYSQGISYLFLLPHPANVAIPHGAALVPQSAGTIKVFIDPEEKKHVGLKHSELVKGFNSRPCCWNATLDRQRSCSLTDRTSAGPRAPWT